MPKFVADVSKEWGEIGFGSSKRDGWAWEVTYSVDGQSIDKHVYKTEKIALGNADRFEAGDWKYSEWKGVDFNV